MTLDAFIKSLKEYGIMGDTEIDLIDFWSDEGPMDILINENGCLEVTNDDSQHRPITKIRMK